jgi:hypothetical protein
MSPKRRALLRVAGLRVRPLSITIGTGCLTYSSRGILPGTSSRISGVGLGDRARHYDAAVHACKGLCGRAQARKTSLQRQSLYVEELIGPDTVNTIPPDTLDAFRDHGRVRGDTVLENLAEAESQLRALSIFGIDLNAITDQLQVDGVAAFASAYDRVLDAIGRKGLDIPHVPVLNRS